MYYDSQKKDGPGQVAFQVGLVAGLLMALIHLVFMLITQDRNSADFIAWIFEWVVIYFAARTAAVRLLKSRQNSFSLTPTSGVTGAAVGAALITMVLDWVFIVLRDVILDVPSFATTIGLLRLPVDVFISLGLGVWAGNGISGRDGYE